MRSSMHSFCNKSMNFLNASSHVRTLLISDSWSSWNYGAYGTYGTHRTSGAPGTLENNWPKQLSYL